MCVINSTYVHNNYYSYLVDDDIHAPLHTVLYSQLHFSAPNAPENLMITSTTSTSIAIMWSPPTDNGGATVTSYSVMVSGGTTSTTATTMTSTTISGLTPNTMYTILVSAVNSAGPGSSSEVAETTLLRGKCVLF